MKTSVIEQLRKLGIKPDKARGQNFLIEPAVIDQILNFARPRKGETLVEIGPGLGALTNALIEIGPLCAIEVEDAFVKHLKEMHPSIHVYHEDIRFFDLTEVGEQLTIFGNLPYSHSSEILFYLLDNSITIKRAILLLQKEFCERLASPPDCKAYGVLSVRTQLLADTRLGPIIEGHVFHPPASVQSRLIELRFLGEPRFQVNDLLTFKQFLATAFGRRRRKLLNCLVSGGQYSETTIREIFSALELNLDVRAENLTIKQLIELSNTLNSPSAAS